MGSRTHRFTLLVVIVASVGCAPLTPGAPGSSAPGSSASGATATPQAPAAPSPPPAPSSAVPDSPTVAEIARLQDAVRTDPADAASQRDLGFALLQRIRETADPSLYGPATAAFAAARRLDPDDALALVGIGGLHLGKHAFTEALAAGQGALDLSPGLAAGHAVVVDALVELGRYDEADLAAQEMLALASDLSTLTRVSYLAELRGELDVALGAMRLASEAPGLAPENAAFVRVHLGDLLMFTGDRPGAAAAYAEALDLVPGHAPALAGQARLAVADGRLEDAIGLLQRAADILPLPEYVIALGEAQSAAGRTAEAARSFALARAEIDLFKASGVIVDVDLALFEADHGDPARALDYASAAYVAAPTIRAADALGWALHRLGRDREADAYAHEALRLGSRDPLLHYHAGAIAAALGDDEAAGQDLASAIATHPGFSASGVAEARSILAGLEP